MSLTATLVGLELTSAVALRLTRGSWTTPWSLSAERREVARGERTVTLAERMTAGAVPHPYQGYVLDPAAGLSQTFREAHGRGVNRFGFLDDADPVFQRREGEAVVGIAGGSVAYWLSHLGRQALEAELRRGGTYAGREIRFVRMALGGYKEPQQLMALQYLLVLGARFDVVVNLDGFNEVALYDAEIASAGVHPSYPRGWAILVGSSSSRERRRLLGKAVFYDSARRRLATWLGSGPLRHSFTVAAVWSSTDRYLEARCRLAQEAMLASRGREESFADNGPREDLAAGESTLSYLTSVWGNSSRQLSRLCRANGIRYIHFLQPNQYLPGSKPMGPEEERIAIAPASRFAQAVRNGYPLLLAEGSRLRDEGVEFHDLTQVFRDHPEPAYADTCCHPNAHGYEILGRAMGQVIAAGPPVSR